MFFAVVYFLLRLVLGLAPEAEDRDREAEIGDSEPQPAPELLEAFLVHALPNACCPKNVPIFLTAWRRGTTVLSLEVAGAGVKRQDVLDLAPAFDQAMAGGG